MKINTVLYEDYQTKDGREIELKREEDTERENRGFTVDEIKAYVDGEEAGYLKLQYIPHLKMEKFYPTIYNWMTQIRGNHVLPFDKETHHYKDLSNEERREMLRNVVYNRFVPWGKEKQYIEQFSDREVMEKLREFEDKLLNHERDGIEFKKFKNYFRDKPFVDFIRVHEGFQRQRIAEAMYLEAAKWMKSRGMKFYASGTQSDDAKAAWDHLSKKHDVRRSKGKKRRYLEPKAA